MAQQTVNLNLLQCTWVNHEYPDTAYDMPEPDYPHYYNLNSASVGKETVLLIQFEALPSNLRRKKLLYANMVLQTIYTTRAVPLMGTFTRNVTTWNTKPEAYPNAVGKKLYIAANSGSTWHNVEYQGYSSFDEDQLSQFASLVMQYNALQVENNGSSSAVRDVLLDGTSLPYLIVAYDDAVSITSHIVYKSGPKSGYNNPRNATTFSWDYEKNDSSIYSADESFEQSSATFYWKESESANYTAVSVSGSNKSVTISANTFPSGTTIQWYVSGTDTDGTTSQTGVFSFSTSAGSAIATAISPINSVEDGSAPIIFTWTLGSTDGQTPSAVDLWWKLPTESNNQWHVLLNEASARTSYTAAAGTFSAGEIQWIVRGYNVDGTAGAWSKPSSGYYSFICVAAPDPVDGLSATAVPLTTISWQSSEQQAYMITIDGVLAKKAFGSDVYSWQVEEPLQEGTHEISVSVQGQYGFWSNPSSVSISVGGPTDDLDMSGEFDIDAVLSTDSTGTIRYYRDGEFIGTAMDNEPFIDNRVLGTHEYFSRILLNDGNYKQSNTVSGEMSVTTKMITALDGSSGWLELRLSENSMDVDEYRVQQDQVLQHIKGAIWPRGDRSSFRDKYATYNCAFVTKEEAETFEALFGKLVILKGKGEEIVIGMLNQVQKRINVFYTSYTFTIQQVYVSEIIT